MKPRRHRLHLRIAIFALLALLWSQTALAWHGMCAAELPAAAAQAMSMQGHGADCHQVPPPADDGDGLCAAHCDQDVPSPDTARVPALPALPALVPAFVSALTPQSRPRCAGWIPRRQSPGTDRQRIPRRYC